MFSSLDDRNLVKLATQSLVEFPPNGTFVFRQGDEGDSCFALCSGRIKVYYNSSDGKDIVVKMLDAGEIFGEVALFDSRPYPAGALCMADCQIVRIDRQHFLGLLDDVEFRNDFIKNILAKLRYLSSRIVSLMAFDVEERFFRYLLENLGPGPEYEIQLSKKDFAAAIGTIPETFSRLLKRLRSRNLVSWESEILKVDQETLRWYQSEAD